MNVKLFYTHRQPSSASSSSRHPFPLPPACRENFLSAGTMAKGPGETGFVEDYMYNKIARNPGVARSVAEYLGKFTSQEEDRTFIKGSQVWTVWTALGSLTICRALVNVGSVGLLCECVAGRRGAQCTWALHIQGRGLRVALVACWGHGCSSIALLHMHMQRVV